jgi:DNA-binding LytR/AlgR family response regulator
MIRAAICDDDPLFMDMIKAKTYDYFMTAGQELDLSCYSSGTPLLLAEKEYHLYLLDIVLPDFSGLELADLIRTRNPRCTIIFISNMHNAVYDSIRYAPLRFIRKENLDTELPEALEAFFQRYKKSTDNLIVSFKEKDSEILLPVSKILYINSVGHYLEVHSVDGIHKSRGKISEYERILSDSWFCRASHGQLLNLRFISYLSGDFVILSNGLQVSLTRTYRSSFISSYMKYQRTVIHAISI